MSDAWQAHWEQVYETRPVTAVSWHQSQPTRSLTMIAAVLNPAAAVIDVGGGASCLVDRLLDDGFEQVTVLDISSHALQAAQARLGARAEQVHWVVADVTTWSPPPQAFDVWHDRAVFHFLVEDPERRAYIRALQQGLRVGGYLILGTFAATGPERCSGLAVQRYSPEELQSLLGPDFTLREAALETHTTPAGAAQDFTWCRFERAA